MNQKYIFSFITLFSAICGISLANPASATQESIEKNQYPISNHNQTIIIAKKPYKSTTKKHGLASYYGKHNTLTAAHRTLPFGTMVKVVNKVNGRSVIVKINDRGPFIRGRIIDVSRGAARKLNMLKAGVVPVRIQILKK
ncbi:MAG: septal ring lytic transglycosylase RlpA family protein [Cyanobacteria bacterium P01_A01_bin.84]